MTTPALRLAPTSRPLPEEETVEDTLDRLAATARGLVFDVVTLRARLAEERHT